MLVAHSRWCTLLQLGLQGIGAQAATAQAAAVASTKAQAVCSARLLDGPHLLQRLRAVGKFAALALQARHVPPNACLLMCSGGDVQQVRLAPVGCQRLATHAQAGRQAGRQASSTH